MTKTSRLESGSGNVELLLPWYATGKLDASARTEVENSLWKIRLGDTTAYELTANSTYDSSPAWSPDGRFIVYTAEDPSGVNLMLLNVATRESTPLTKGGDIYADPVFSPDGKTIAFVRGEIGRASCRERV